MIRKATDSDSVDLSPEIYPEILQKFEFVDELVVRQTMQYLYARIFLTSDHHPTTVFKGLDLCRYLLFHGSHSLQEDIKNQLSSFKTLQTRFFTPSQHTKYSNIQKFYPLSCWNDPTAGLFVVKGFYKYLKLIIRIVLKTLQNI